MRARPISAPSLPHRRKKRYAADSQRMSLVKAYFREAAQILEQIDEAAVERLLAELVIVRERGGRLFVLGVGRKRGQRLARGQ